MRNACLVIWFIIALAPFGLDATAVTIKLKSEAQVDGPRLALGEVAAITDADPALIGKLEKIDLGPAPWPGSHYRVDGIVVRLRLYQNHLDPRQISVKAKAGCRVTTRGRQIPADAIIAVAREHLLSHIQWPKGDVELVLACRPKSYVVPFGCKGDILLAAPINAANLRGSVEAAVQIMVDGKPRFKIPVRFNAKLYERAVVATRAVHRGEPFTAENVKLKKVEVTRRAPGLITDLKRVLKRRAAHPISANAPIVRRMVISPPLIRRGDLVRMVFRQKGLEITARGQARQDGAEGDIIRVENIDSGRPVSGRVIDARTVLVGG